MSTYRLTELVYDENTDRTPAEIARHGLDPSPALAAAMAALTEDGDTFELADGRTLTLRIVSEDEERGEWTGVEYLNDCDGFGRVAWSGHRDGRPDGFDGAASIVYRQPVQGGSVCWWQPPTAEEIGLPELDAEWMAECKATVARIVEDGVLTVRLVLTEKVRDSAGGEHEVEMASASLHEVDSFYPEIIGELAGEIISEVEDHHPDSRPNGSCDECDAAIPDAAPGEVRSCPRDPAHDPYSDGHNNGGDPVRDEDGREILTPIAGYLTCRYVLVDADDEAGEIYECLVHGATSIGHEISCEHAPDYDPEPGSEHYVLNPDGSYDGPFTRSGATRISSERDAEMGTDADGEGYHAFLVVSASAIPALDAERERQAREDERDALDAMAESDEP